MAAVDGLVSGIDVTSIISQLIQVDSATQNRLKTNVSTAQTEIKGYQSVNTKMAALQTAAEALTRATGWKPVTATSSSPNVSVSAGATADEGSATFTVNRLASTKSVLSKAQAKATDSVNPSDFGFPIDVMRNGKKLGTISPATGTMSELAASINKASDLGVKAVAIRVSADQYRLQITSDTSGEAGGFQLLSAGTTNDAEARFDVLAPAQDAEIGLGIQGLAVTSSTNTFADIIPGVTFTAQKADPELRTTVSSLRDTGKLGDAVKGLVDAANAALTEIANQSKAGVVGSDGKVTAGGALNGDSTLRGLQSQIINAVTYAFGGGASAASFGLQSTRNGQLSFDKDKFLTAYTADPVKVQNLIAPTSTPRPVNADPSVPTTPDTRSGLVERLLGVAKSATAANTGSLTTAVAGRNSSIKDLTSRIDAWDDRLAAKKASYQKYYSRLETSLGSLKTQSTWLAGQLSSLA